MAHTGWLFRNTSPERWTRGIKDLLKDPTVVQAHRLYFAYVMLGLLAPSLAVGLITQSWYGLFTGFLWGGLVRIFLVNHVVWSINSICHMSGSTAYRTRDDSRNNYWLVLPRLASPSTTIITLSQTRPPTLISGGSSTRRRASYVPEFCGLAWDVRSPSLKEKRDKALNPASQSILVAKQETT